MTGAGNAGLGIGWLIDNAHLEELAATSERLGRREITIRIDPLRIVNGAGAPVNPIATP